MNDVKENECVQRLNHSFQFCRDLAYKSSSSFYAGMAQSPTDKRDAIFSIYAWLRLIDDIADDEALSAEQRAAKLRKFSAYTQEILCNSCKNNSESKENFWLAFYHTVHHYQIPLEYFSEMIAGQEQDLIKHDYKTFAELYDYCHHVASTVGLMCIHIWGYDNDPKSRQMAEWCGIACQLTNILRDINSDRKSRHVYLPAEFVGKKELTSDQLADIPHDLLMQGISTLIKKTEYYYQNSLQLYHAINPDSRLSFLYIMYKYKTLFEKIRHQPEAIFKPIKIKLNMLEILKLYFVVNMTRLKSR